LDQVREFEAQLQAFTRARAILKLGILQELHMPEVLWKTYIDFEIEEGERELAHLLYERLVSVSGNLKVWVSYAMFRAEPIPVVRNERNEEIEEEEERELVPGDSILARQVFERDYKDLKNKGLKQKA
jgi:crooked neck